MELAVTPRLAVDGLSFGYPGRVVGRDVSLALSGGEVMCLLGPNGGGKTTLFKTVLGLLPPVAGAVAVDGEPTAGWTRARRALAFGYVPQAAAGLFPYTVRDVVLMGRTARVGLFATPSRHDREVAGATIDALGIGHLADRPYTEVSGGERQLSLVARALAQEPCVLVMDEPTASLDFGNQARVIGRIRDLADRGIAVVLSTHDPGHAFACADRVALMRAGRIVATGPPEAVLTPAALRELYGVAVAVAWLEAAGRHVCAPSLDQTRRKP